MAEIDGKYTAKLIEQGDRVENQLQKRISNIEFRRQGSITNNTHIRAESDVDVLVITEDFVTLESPQQPKHPYKGNSVQTILQLRHECVATLNSTFPQATVDDSGSYSVAVSGGSLICKVDVVPSNWYDSNQFAQFGYETYRGIRVLNKNTRVFSVNYPFLTNFRLKQQNDALNEKPCMSIRLIKNMKVDAKREYDISSYDICSIVYRGADSIFNSSSEDVLKIASDLFSWLHYISNNKTERDKLMVIDNSRRIFDKPEKIESLVAAVNDLGQLILGAMQDKTLQV